MTLAIGVLRIRTIQFHSDSNYDCVTWDQVNLSLRESQTEASEPTNHTFPWVVTTPTIQHSIDYKGQSHEWHWKSASVGLIFSGSCCSVLLITAPTLLLVKATLRNTKDCAPQWKFAFNQEDNYKSFLTCSADN